MGGMPSPISSTAYKVMLFVLMTICLINFGTMVKMSDGTSCLNTGHHYSAQASKSNPTITLVINRKK